MADSYCHKLLKIAIAQICQGLGWHAIQTTPCDLLNDVLQRYIEHMAGSAHRYAEQYGRTEPSLDDVALAFSDMQVHLSEFEVYLRDVDPVPFVHPLPQFPVAKKTNLQHPRPGSRDCRERLWYIPAHMPPLVGVSRDLAEVVDPIDPGGQSISAGYPYSREDDSASADTPYEYTPGHATPRGEKRELLNPYNEQTMKRLRLADDGTPQELTAVFMGVNGELTPKREGKLPEATTPPQRDWHRPSLPQSPLARKGSEGLTGDMPHRRTPDATSTPPLIRPPKSPKASAKLPVSPKVKGPPPPKPKPKSPKHLMFSPHAPSKYQVKPKTPVGSVPVVDLAKPEQVPSPAPKSPKGGYLSSILNTSKKPPESPKVVQEPPKTPILSSLMKKKESAKDTALKVYDFEDDFDFSSAPSKDRPHAAMDSFASSKVPSSKPLTEPKQEPLQYSTSESIDASIEAVVSGNITRNPLSLVQETGKSKKNKQSKEKSDKKEKSKEKHKDKHKDKEKSKDSKEKNREEKKQEEKKEATVVFGGSSPYSFEDSFSAAIKKRDDAQKSSKGHSLPPKIFLKNAWKEGEGAVTSSIRIGSEPGQAPKLVIKTENPTENPSENEGKKQGAKSKDKTKLKMKKKEKLKLKKKKEKLMKKKLEKKKMLQSKAPSTDKSERSSSNPKEEEAIPKMNIVSQGPAGLKIHLSSSPQVTPEHKSSTKEEKDKSKEKSKKKKKDKDKKQKKKEGKKDTKKSESKKEEKEKEKKEKKAKGDSAASSPAPGPPAIPKITLKLGAKPSGVEKSRQIVIKPTPTPVSPPSPKVVTSLSPPTSPVRKPAQKASPKPKSPKPKSPKPKSPATPKSPPTPKSPKSPPPPMLPIPVPPVRKASLAASKAVSAMSAPRAKGVSPPSAQKAAPEKRQGAAKGAAASGGKAASSKAATSPKPAPVPTKAALAVGKGPPATPAAGKAAASTSKDKDDDVQRTVITETVGTVVSDTGEKIWICPACKLPDDGSPMVGCDDCDDWYHWPCVGLEDEPEEENWYCSKCLKAKKQAPKAKKKKKKHKD